jgi:hypothetical protein
MWRALLVVILLTAPAAAQTGSLNYPYTVRANPYNPYASSLNRGTIQFRPYVSFSRLHVQHQIRFSQADYFAVSGSNSTVLAANSTAAVFGQYPNYPRMSALTNPARALSSSTAKGLGPRPQTAPVPTELGCDPYLDDDGCLGEYAGW